MDWSQVKQHNGNCLKCKTTMIEDGRNITTYDNAMYCPSCTGYLCACADCETYYHQGFNPRVDIARCPKCVSHGYPGNRIHVATKKGWG